jgi:hypothetical protein
MITTNTTTFQSLFVFLIFLSSSPDKSHGFSIRRNSKGQPRLCSVVTATLDACTRLALGKSSSKQISVQAESNRKVLHGQFQEISIAIKNSQSPLCKLKELNVQVQDLNLGYTPFLVSIALPFTFLCASPSLLLCLFLSTTLIRNQRRRFLITESSSSDTFQKLEKRLQTLYQKAKSVLGGSTSLLKYTFTLTDQSIIQSAPLSLFAKSLVQSFMSNSVLPLAAAAGDTAKQLMLLQEQETSSQNGALALWKENTLSSFQLSKLLSATSFELRGDPTFANNGYLLLPCVASLPNDQGALDFTLRTKLTPRYNIGISENPLLVERRKTNGLEFEAADCRVDVDTVLPAANEWTKKLLPSVVWLPIGSVGMVLPLGKSHSIKRLLTRDDGTCDIIGQFELFPKKEEKQTLKTGLQNIVRRLGLPSSSSNSKKKLPPTRRLPGKQ